MSRNKGGYSQFLKTQKETQGINYSQFLAKQKKNPALSREDLDFFQSIIKTPETIEIIYPRIYPIKRDLKRCGSIFTTMEDAVQKIDIRTSFIIEDIPYLLILTDSLEIYRVYFPNLNFFKAYKRGKNETYTPYFLELFDLFGIEGENKLFLGVGNYRHISFMIPPLLEGKKVKIYSMRMNGRSFCALDPIKKVIQSYRFKREKYEFNIAYGRALGLDDAHGS